MAGGETQTWYRDVALFARHPPFKRVYRWPCRKVSAYREQMVAPPRVFQGLVGELHISLEQENFGRDNGHCPSRCWTARELPLESEIPSLKVRYNREMRVPGRCRT